MKRRKEIGIFITLLLTMTALPIIGSSTQPDVTLGNCYTTDYVNGWQDTGLRIKEWPIDGEVYAYVEVYADNLQGVLLTHRWWYDNGTGLVNVWEWDWEIPEPWESCWSYTYWQIGLDYGKGWGYIEVLADGESIGTSNNYAMDNTKPNNPTITGPTQGGTNVEHDYTFSAIDPDGFDVFLCIDWGDDTGEICIGPIASGEEYIASHTWTEDGTYQIKCKARDLVDSESGETILEVTMPKNKGFNFNIIERILERFPNAFPILRHLWKV